MKKGVNLLLLVVVVAITVASMSSIASAQGPPVCLPEATHNVTIRGTVYNSTYGLAATNTTILNQSVNISIYNLTFSNQGEPVRAFVNGTVTNSSSVGPGTFSLAVAGANCFAGSSPVFYTLDVVLYNSTGWVALEMGPSFPPLPITVINETFNGGSLYLQNASTLKLYALNVSGGARNFSYIIFDDKLGYPLAEQFASRVWNASVVVPRGRNFTVIFMASPKNDDPTSFETAVPPISVAVPSPMIEGNASSQFVLNITKDLTYSQYTINGTINVTGNKTAVNITNVLVKLGMAGLMPPNSEIAIPDGLNITNVSGGSASGGYPIANYSVTVMGASTGIYQVIEWYAANTTSVSGGDYFGALQNFTVTGNVNHDVVLTGLAGTFTSQSSGTSTLATRYVSLNLTDSAGSPLDDAHVELKVEMPGHKTTLNTFRYLIDQLSSGVARLPMINTSNATLLVFNRQYAPLEFKINLTNASLYPNGIIRITLNTFEPRKFNPNGTIEKFNSSNKASEFRLVFMKNSAACNVYTASISDCRLGNEDFDVGRFNPLKAMVASKVNIYSEINTTGVIIYFIGVDMIGSGPPEGAMSDQPLQDAQNAAGTGAIRKQIWRFGSVAPPIYDKVFIGIPYNESNFNETGLFNISFDYLLDADGGVIWNATLYPNAENIPDDYADYNSSWFNASSGGMRCVNETPNMGIQQCQVNTTTNYVWLNIPHFSDIDPPLSGQGDTTPPYTPPNLTAANVSDNDNDGNIEINWTEPGDETGESYVVYRFSSNISTFNHSLTNITPSRVAEGVMFFEDNESSNNTNYWYAVVAVDSEGNLNTSSGAAQLSASFNASSNDAVIPKSPTGLNVTSSGTTATLRWLGVTQDIDGNPDAYGIQYNVYRLGPNSSSINASTSNVSRAMPGVTPTTVSSNTTTYTVTATSGGTGHYYFVVTSLDDGGNENMTVEFNGTNLNYFNVSLNETAYSPPSSPSSGGSSGGGGGGAAADPDAETSQSRMWDALASGSTSEFKVTKTGIPVTSLKFTINEDVSDIELTVTKLTAAPSYVKASYGGKAYAYISIAKSNLKETSVSSAVIKIKVEKKWISTAKAASSDVRLLRYDRDVWNDLNAVVSTSDELYYYYEADSPGLSVFLIALKEPEPAKSAASDADADADAIAAADAASQVNESAEPSGEGKGKTGLYIAIALIALAAAGGAVGFIYYRKSKGAGLSEEESKPAQEKSKPQE